MSSHQKFTSLSPIKIQLHVVSLLSPYSVSQCMMSREQSRQGSDLGCVCDSVEWTLKQRACKNTGQHIDPGSGEEPPAGYSMQLKVERSLRNIIMMFVTAHDSARVENKRGASGSVLNGAEERLREMGGEGGGFIR